jgi:hypothetical protein
VAYPAAPRYVILLFAGKKKPWKRLLQIPPLQDEVPVLVSVCLLDNNQSINGDGSDRDERGAKEGTHSGRTPAAVASRRRNGGAEGHSFGILSVRLSRRSPSSHGPIPIIVWKEEFGGVCVCGPHGTNCRFTVRELQTFRTVEQTQTTEYRMDMSLPMARALH